MKSEYQPALDRLSDLTGYPSNLLGALLCGDLDIPSEGIVVRLKERSDLGMIVSEFSLSAEEEAAFRAALEDLNA